MSQKIIIDTDPGVDDAMAIQLAFNSPELDVIGLTTVFGNVGIDLTTENTLRLVELAGRPDVPVARGAAKPLHGIFNGGVPFVHGDDGQGNTFRPQSSLKSIELDAADFIIEQLKKHPGEIILVPVGPLTNLALALQKAPEIQNLVKEVVIMGGNAFCPGNATPTAEANIYSDPEAADLVFGAEWSVTMVGLDVTHKVFLSKEQLAEIGKGTSAINQHVAAAYVFYQDFFMKTNQIDGSFIHDSSAIAYVIDKSIFTTVQHPVRVETADCISRGKVWPLLGDSDHEERPALRAWAGRPKVNICVDVAGEKVVDLLMKRLH
ncbi:MAG: nucleoside hydrolase [Bacteroidota bacterium]